MPVLAGKCTNILVLVDVKRLTNPDLQDRSLTWSGAEGTYPSSSGTFHICGHWVRVIKLPGALYLLPVVTEFPPSYSCILGCFVQIKSLGNVRSGKEYVQTRIVEISYLLCETSSWLFSCGLLITLMMEAVCTSETSVYFHETTRHYIP
jgi:hypothetical protein